MTPRDYHPARRRAQTLRQVKRVVLLLAELAFFAAVAGALMSWLIGGR